MPQEYDNTNKGAAWVKAANGKPLPALGGKLNIEGQDAYIDIVPTGGTDPAPKYQVYVRAADINSIVGYGALWPDKAMNKRDYTGTLYTLDGGQYWLSGFRNKDSQGRAYLRLTLQAKEAQAAQPPQQPEAPAADDSSIPF